MTAGTFGRGTSALGGLGGARKGAGWRSHTFDDGIHAITLTRRLDATLAAALRVRVREVVTRGRGGVIVDVRAADATNERHRHWIAEAVDVGAASRRIVVVVPTHGELARWLPRDVQAAGTLPAARLLLEALRAGSRERRRGPAHEIPAAERHELAVRQSLRWAEAAAAEGDFGQALSWLATVEAVEGGLPGDWSQRRDAWRARLTA